MTQNKNQTIFQIALSGVAIFLATFLFLFVFSTQAAVSKNLNYQGLLADSTGTAVADGSYTLHLKIYTLAGGGSSLWSSDPVVTTKNGVFSTIIDISALDFNGSSFYLGVAVNADPEMTPRKQLGSVPQAINANNLIGDGLIDITGGATIGGNVGIGTTSPAYKLDIVGTLGVGSTAYFASSVGIGTTAPAAKLTVAGGDIYLASSGGDNSRMLLTSNNSSTFVSRYGTDDVEKSLLGLEGTQAYISAGNAYIQVRGDNNAAERTKIDAGTAVNNTGANVGMLLVGDFSALGTAGDAYTALLVNATDTADLDVTQKYLMDLQTGSASKFLVTSTGNVGIGTTAPANFMLQVAGHVGPDADDTYTLGSASYRWSDVYVGPSTLHIGSTATDEGTISYNTTNNILNIGTDSTTNGDIAFFTDDLFLDKSTGNIGIGTTNPTYGLHVSGTLGIGSTAYFASNVGIGTTAPAYKLDVNGTTRVSDLISSSIVLPGNTLTSQLGFNGFLNSSGGLGTGGISRITETGNLQNIGSIQAGEMNLTRSGTFATKVDYGTGTAPQSVSIGDLNGDDQADLAVANYTTDNVSVLLNNGNGTFATKVDYGAGDQPYSVSIGDLNGDGNADLAVANAASTTVSVLINDGDGTFDTPDIMYGTGSVPYSVAIGDLNGDGKADLAVANTSNQNVSVLLNNGNGTFATKVDYGVGIMPQSVSIGDLNGDGQSDLAIANYNTDNVSVLLNNGNGTFATKVDYGAGDQPYSVSIGDLNGDGQADLAVANRNTDNVSVLLNNGNGTFATKVDYGAGDQPCSVSIGDLNGDGQADLAVVNIGTSNVSILLNNGNGTFATKVDYGSGTGPISVFIGDLNGDGQADLAVANRNTNNVSVLLNQPQSMFFAQASTGNIGIGTTAPSSLLDLQLSGTAKADNTLLEITNSTNAADMDGTLSSILFNQYYYGGTPASVSSGKISIGTETDWTSTASTQDSFLSLQTALDGTVSEKMRITSGGLVGIGTTNPTYGLDVVGTLGIGSTAYFASSVGIGTTAPDTTLKVVGSICASATDVACAGTTAGAIYADNFIAGGTALNIPDYVFEADYNLMPLDQLAAYIQTYKHLPGVPSADDVERAGGLNLGQMVPAILEKTEENTLYILGMSNDQLQISNQIQNLNLKTDKITTLEGLQKSIDEKMGIVELGLKELDKQLAINTQEIATLKSKASGQDSLIAILQGQVAELQTRFNTGSAFGGETNLAQIDLNTQSITTLEMRLGTQRVIDPKDVDILGKLSSKALSTGGIEIVVVDPEAKTIGTAVIKLGEKSVIVPTKAVMKNSKIFATPFGITPIAWIVSEVKEGESFTLLVNEPLIEETNFNWWIVQSD